MAISALLDNPTSSNEVSPSDATLVKNEESAHEIMSVKKLTTSDEASSATRNDTKQLHTSQYRKLKPVATLPVIANDDISFDVVSPMHMETAFQTANEPDYAEEKANYLQTLQARIHAITMRDEIRMIASRNSFLEQNLNFHSARVPVQRKHACKELQHAVVNKILKIEKRQEKEEKRQLKLAQQRERRAKKAAAAAAAAAAEAEATGKAPLPEPKPKRGRQPVIAKANGNAPHSKIQAGDSNSPSNVPTLSPAKSKAAEKKKEVVKKEPAVKIPSQKEVRAVARLYANTYESIWKEMARKDASKTYRLIHSASNVRVLNAKKTSQLASKEARKWQARTNKSMKDLQNKARRSMREMLLFWKRNEREERELRKKAEIEAQQQARKEEEEREARRQARKLNFLISQTELYTHFIGRKMDTTQPVETQRTVDDLDFDEADDDELRQVAIANAQKAYEDTQARARAFDGDSSSSELKKVDLDGEEMNFQNPTSLGDIQIPQPGLLRCQLKEYQIKGLSWLANLYEQGINGILADEMGLGKTVQSISVMAYLAETHNIWGPFLVVTPASTLHNWQQEITKFVPDFKVLPYWGNAKDRKILRKFWDYKNVRYSKDSQFHVLVTSYQMVVADANYFQKMRWQYMILDEAQAIKSSASSRWKALLSFHCRNRLLLTGTPIQNSMQELWALLHFIMPSLFDSHDEFSEWFSKDIESHAQSNTKLNQQQLSRLHMILKPFMLRRLKKHVQSELGDKIEEDVYCDLTSRQRFLYKTLRSQISLMDLIEKAASGSDEGTQSLMNLVMQFRKVCNHPDLFERADVRSAFNFSQSISAFGPVRDGSEIDLYYVAQNSISYTVPKLLYRDGGFLDVPNQGSPAGFRSKFLENMLSIWDPENVNKSPAFSWSRLIDLSPGEVARAGKSGLFERAVTNFSYGNEKSASVFSVLYDNEEDEMQTVPNSSIFLINEQHSLPAKSTSYSTGILETLLNVGRNVLDNGIYNVIEPAFDEPSLCPPISLEASDHGIFQDQENLLFDKKIKRAMFPLTLEQEWSYAQAEVPIHELPASNLYPWARNNRIGFTTLRMPSMSKFVTDSGKLSKLDQMLPVLKAEGHRILIYFQMTRMMDLMEEYLTFRQYKYVRLDGSSKLSERRDLVNDWQTKPELFVFLLSTRAGGLGINLTAADTVIFYDSDWNPTIDSQAMDRAHRMGQTRQVTVYRLLVKGTIEERMRDRAKQKEHVQQVVMEGGGGAAASVDFQKPGREVAYWLLDDDEAANAMIKNSAQEETSATSKDKAGLKRASIGGNEKTSSASAGSSGVGAMGFKKLKSAEAGLEAMYHEGEGNFDESSQANSPVPSRVGTPVGGASSTFVTGRGGRGGRGRGRGAGSNRRRMTTEQRLKAVGDV
ncbi:hypothetical protein D0Z00_003610 [Geotrichum galactomycetum]|uniref:Uncharacterized protein n=1 Tax=Geotrichum galactomycetum TaxID=27317 RepID=A0ACB6V0Q6_9ASCO|nr:hypothetical protein D0Z00_003610 [Geotrichum candidum]